MKRVIAALVLCCLMPTFVAAQSNGPTSPKDAPPDALPTTTGLVCYFKKGTTVTWYWGLNNDTSWYALNGTYNYSPYTKLTRFFTVTQPSALMASCDVAKSYNGWVAYSLLAFFAAHSQSGSNYPIVANQPLPGQKHFVLFPQD